MLDHENRVRDEFTRQAETFSASAAITDTALTQRFITALGEAIRGSVLDVACGPGILSAAMAKAARDDGEEIRFFHRWNLIAARKPGGR